MTALDIYNGYFGIEDNTPDRLMVNAQAAGVADRLDWMVGDMRRMPVADREYDAVVSSYAMDHVGLEGAAAAVRETARVRRGSRCEEGTMPGTLYFIRRRSRP